MIHVLVVHTNDTNDNGVELEDIKQQVKEAFSHLTPIVEATIEFYAGECIVYSLININHDEGDILTITKDIKGETH